MTSVDDYMHGYFLNKIHTSPAFDTDLKAVVDGWSSSVYKDDKFFNKSGVTYESLKAMTLFAGTGNPGKIEKSLKKLVKDNGFTLDEGTDNEIFFVSSKNTYSSSVMCTTYLNYAALDLWSMTQHDLGLTPERLAAWKNYFEQKAASSNSLCTIRIALKAMEILKKYSLKP